MQPKATLPEIQQVLPWGDEYSDSFKSSQQKHKDFAHALTHIFKAAGKLAAMVEEADHQDSFEIGGPEVVKYVADLAICALRLANVCPGGSFDVLDAIIARLEARNGIWLSPLIERLRTAQLNPEMTEAQVAQEVFNDEAFNKETDYLPDLILKRSRRGALDRKSIFEAKTCIHTIPDHTDFDSCGKPVVCIGFCQEHFDQFLVDFIKELSEAEKDLTGMRKFVRALPYLRQEHVSSGR